MTVYRKCACDAYFVNPEDATYVKDFRPMCPAATCEKVRQNRGRGYEYIPEFPAPSCFKMEE